MGVFGIGLFIGVWMDNEENFQAYVMVFWIVFGEV